MEEIEEIEVEDGDKEELGYDDIESEEAEYSSKSDFSKAKIVYEAMTKCIEARGKEMKSGYYNNKMNNDGTITKMWVEDSRQIFIGTVEVLRGLLSPEIKNEENYKNAIKKYYDKKKEIKKEYIYKERMPENKDGRILFKETGRKFIPEIGSKVIVRDLKNPQSAQQIVGGWDNYINAYWDNLVILYDFIFALLNDLINNLNYFKQMTAY